MSRAAGVGAGASCNSAGGCLFNVREDPCEHRDLSAAMPEKVQELQGRLANYTIIKNWKWEAEPASCLPAAKNGTEEPCVGSPQ